MAAQQNLNPYVHTGGKERIAVIGAGIIGLHTAIRAQELGHPVTLYSARTPLETTSAKAGASFMPHAVVETDATDEMLGYGWGSYERLANDHPEAGVNLQTRWEASSFPITPSRFHRTLAQNLDLVDGRDNIPGGYPHALRYKTFKIDTREHLMWLEKQFKSNGGNGIIPKTFIDVEQLTELPEKVIFNSTGLGSTKLFHDEQLVPVKGQIVVVDALPSMDYTVSADGFYVYPHADRTLLGGTVENYIDNEGVDPGAEQLILRGNFPVLAAHVADRSFLHVRNSYAGLRPYRSGSVRVEREEIGDKLVIHNYGHGGSGITLAPGSAKQAIDLIP